VLDYTCNLFSMFSFIFVYVSTMQSECFDFFVFL
jgi:hypothetical protein